MDEQEMIRFLRSELYQAMERDPELRAALKHIDAGKGTFQDTAQYSERTSELFGQILSRHVDELPEGMREAVCKALLRERYEEVNGICAEVQEQLDAQNGIRLQPQRASYPAERVQQVAHALEDPTVALSVIQRRAKAPVANVSKSFHDDYIRENAEVRSRLGFKCYLNRVAATGCCKWCTDIAGRYVYGDHPDEVFHRHDNCGCTVTYENGRERQDVWSKRKWQEDPAEVLRDAQQPVVNSQERAAEIEQTALSRLTLAGERDILRVAGGITGALDPDGQAAEEHAARYYAAVRKMTTDVQRIAQNTGFSEAQIQEIKSFIFLEKHDLGDGRIDYFDPSYTMAESWQRLIDGKQILEHDITLLQHETMERSLMQQGYSQSEAHLLTCKKYNYEKEARQYYDQINRNQKG